MKEEKGVEKESKWNGMDGGAEIGVWRQTSHPHELHQPTTLMSLRVLRTGRNIPGEGVSFVVYVM